MSYANYHCFGFDPTEHNTKSDFSYEEEVISEVFKVISKETGITYEVYAVKESKFLIFFNNRFEWYNMNKFRPTRITEEEKVRQNEHDRKRDIFKSTKDRYVNVP